MRKDLHLSVPEKPAIQEQDGWIDSHMAEAQRIEGGGPRKKIVVSQLPRPIRIFAYGFMAITIMMLIMTLIVSIWK